MRDLTGAGVLARAALRRDRLRLALWVLAIGALVVTTGTSTKRLYPTQHDLDVVAIASEDNPAAIAFNGPPIALDTMGGQIAFQVGATGLVLVALMSVLLTVRLTRVEEEGGRLELLRSLAVGHHAPTVSAVLVVLAATIGVGTLTTASLLTLDLPVTGCIAMGATFTATGAMFVAVAAVTVQISDNPRVASGLAGAVLGAAFVLRAVADISGGTVSWLSPIGLAQKLRPFGGEQWWVLLPCLAVTGILLRVAVALETRRDFGGGLVAPRRGPAEAAPGLGRPLGLAIRLQRAAVLWWAFGLFLLGAAYGSVADGIEDFVADNEALADIIATIEGVDLVKAYLATTCLIQALTTAGFTTQAVLRLRSEETAGRAEAVLVAGTSRARWVASHVVVAVVGSALVAGAGGLGVGLAYGLVTGDAAEVPPLVGASLVHVPALLVIAAASFAAFGAFPRVAASAWGLLAGCLVLGMFGTLLDLPQLVLDLSPFQHIPGLPAEGVQLLPLAALTGVALAVGTFGFLAFERRDVGG